MSPAKADARMPRISVGTWQPPEGFTPTSTSLSVLGFNVQAHGDFSHKSENMFHVLSEDDKDDETLSVIARQEQQQLPPKPKKRPQLEARPTLTTIGQPVCW